MEECAQQSMNGQGPSAALNNVNRPEEDNNQINQRPKYTIPGILHYLQHEWTRFEMEKSEWEANKAELEAKINFLQGECKGQENLKNDLIRRIKMLEFALKQERAKYHKLKYGTELIQGDITPPVFEETAKEKEVTMNELAMDTDVPFSSGNSLTWKQGRSLLRQYLQELGYTDTIIDVRSSRVKNLLGLYNINNAERNNTSVKPTSDEKIMRYRNHTMFSKNKIQDTKKGPKKTLAENMMMDVESTVMGKLDFLTEEGGQVAMEEDDDDDFELNEDSDDISKCKIIKQEPMEEVQDVDAEAEEVLNELHLITENEEAMDIRSQNVFPVSGIVLSAEDDTVDASLGLGDLAQLTVNNDAETTYGTGTAKEPLRKTWSAKYTLRSHFDGVRALAFHPIEPILITASEDMTLKLWNLQKTVTAKKSASLDVEPLYTFRKHLSPVLSVAISGTGEQCYSGCLNGDINCWNIPFGNIDPYDTYDPSVLVGKFTGHTDAVWAIALHSQKPQLLSASADGTVKLWSPSQPNLPLLSTYVAELADGIPTSADFVRDDLNRMIVSYTSGRCVVFDLETGKPIFKMEQPAEKFPSDQINKVICHPTLPLTITAHEDRHIRFYDNITGKMVHWMVAHLDAVTSLAVDPNGLFLLSGSHDCSIRLWNLDNKTCVQEMTAHRKKFDESIYDVAFHPSRPFIASCGADALAKVFV